ncbi:ClpP family protease [Campylobacter suis]|uniref:ATP-dependent Clp protease proteolytic subunit n=1 Tax=Campylobacter suis TaxID=2790657 RepID=A0ABN7KAC5_9BACT|nr:ATP-dependent Clp protease proteolytic subunit [Campylobacter suis]CAD7289035.1 ATP-dependent Clp protease proteolytic subunit [Campylobacter suis]
MSDEKLNIADIPSMLLADRNIFLYGQIDMEVCLSVQKQLLYLNGIDDTSEINIYISGPGGSIYDGFGLIDFMQTIKAPINTICVGLAASMSALIFLHGDKRYMLPNSQLMLHQPLGGAQGQASDIELVAKQIIKIKSKINEMIVSKSKLELKKVEILTDRDCYIDANMAIKYGLTDELTSNKG